MWNEAVSSKQALKGVRQADTAPDKPDHSCFPRKPSWNIKSPQAALLKRKGPWRPRFCTAHTQAQEHIARNTETPLCGEPFCRDAALSMSSSRLLGSAAVNPVCSPEESDNLGRKQAAPVTVPPSLLLPWLVSARTCLRLQLCTAFNKSETYRLLQLLLSTAQPKDKRPETASVPAPLRKSHRPQLTHILPWSQQKWCVF